MDKERQGRGQRTASVFQQRCSDTARNGGPPSVSRRAPGTGALGRGEAGRELWLTREAGGRVRPGAPPSVSRRAPGTGALDRDEAARELCLTRDAVRRLRRALPPLDEERHRSAYALHGMQRPVRSLLALRG